MSVDPDLAETDQPYAYAGDDPVNGADPSGLASNGWLYGAAPTPCGVIALPPTGGLPAPGDIALACQTHGFGSEAAVQDMLQLIDLEIPYYVASANQAYIYSVYQHDPAAACALEWQTTGSSASAQGWMDIALGVSIVGAGYFAGLGEPDVAPAPEGEAVVDPNKWDYIFGRVASNTYNAARSTQNAAQLARIGLYDTPEGRALLQANFEETVSSNSNIIQSFTNTYGEFQVRESLFAGPGGFLKFETTWQVTQNGYRFITLIPYGGS